MDNKVSILIAEDDVGMSETLSDILEEKGYDVVTTEVGAQAVAEVKSRRFDLALIGMMMPGMNGVETLREIKRVSPQTTIMIMTGRGALEGMVSEAIKAGVDGVLYKPFEVDAIVKMIESKSEARTGPPLIDLKKYQVQSEALRLIPEEMAKKHAVIPLCIEGGSLVVAMGEPENLYIIDEIQKHVGMQVRPLRASLMDVRGAINRYYRTVREIAREIEVLASADVARVPAARIMDLLIAGAVQDGASDIHIEPQQDHLRVRYRIDGHLHDRLSLPLSVHVPLLSRLKIIAKMDTTERRRPQDGQFTVSVDDRDVINVRAAMINTQQGEVAVLRVRAKSLSVIELPELGFLSDSLKTYQKLLQSPSGLILVSGPTGTGKTTTLYASIEQLNIEERSVITIEDPIEHYFDDVKQIEVNSNFGLSFSGGLRAIMRLDPDIILASEIRDEETARAVLQAALSGLLVLSSVPANTVTGALFRLIDLGVEPFLISSAVTCVTNQRLVRRVCPHCSSLREATEEERLLYEEVMGEARAQFHYGAGCKFCAGTGYLGRTGVFEVLRVTGEIKRMLIGGAHGKEIKDQAVKEGMTTLQHAGMQKVKEGLTTPYEVLRNVFSW